MVRTAISFSGEDGLSEALARRCVAYSLPDSDFHSMRPAQGGKEAVKVKFPSYLRSATAYRFFVMLDLDDVSCAPALRAELLGSANVADLPRNLVLAVVKREAEAWVLGDRDSLARFLDVKSAIIPQRPEELADPKATLVQIARRSVVYRKDFCPKKGTTSKVGAGYNDIVSDFVRNHWRPDVAANTCGTLHRTLERLRNMNGLA
jgi:hypothetical protein